MGISEWSDLSQVGLLLFAVPSTLFLGFQLADIKRGIRAEMFEATARRLVEITRLGLANPREYALLKEDLEQYDLQTSLLAEGILDAIDTELLRRRALPDSLTQNLPPLEPYFVDLLVELPGLYRTLKRRRAWYSAEIWNLAADGRGDD